VGHLHPDPLICLGPDFPCVGHPVVDLIGFFSEVAVSTDLVDQASGFANGLAIKFGALMGR